MVGQGVVNGLLPAFNDLTTVDKKPTGAVFGAAKNANLVDVSNIYWDFANSKLYAYTFAVYGYDGQRSTLATGAVNPLDTDGIQMTSNSYGSSNEDNDGWDFDGRYISRRIRLYGNYVSHLDSTGNGAPAYGTTTPPNADVGIAVGASTEFGSTGWDSITNTTQIQFNEIIPFSNRGPTARGNNGVDVVANGAYAAGDEALNYFTAGRYGDPNGNLSWDSWGGTSRSAPSAMGNLALLYQAFKAANGRWPTYLEARTLFKSGATDLNYDTLTQGGGSVNSDRATLVAGEWYGLAVSPDEWNPGAYRGVDYPGFAHVLKPGETDTTAVTVTNTGIAPITAQVSLENPRLIRSDSFTYSVTPAMFIAKSTENFYKAPQFILPITAQADVIAANPWWNGHDIPAGTDLMVVTMRYPLAQFDNDANYTANNRWRLAVYGWTDINGDNDVWEDLNGNGVVNYVFNPADPATTSDGGIELRWDDPTTEIDRWEYARVGYSRPGGNVLQIAVHDPRDQMKDGWFIGLTQYTATALDTTDFQFTIEYYENQQAPSWLTADAAELTIPAGGTGTFNLTAAAGTLPAGMYEGSVKIIDPGATVSGQVTGPNGTVTLTNEVFPGHTSVVPVVMTVAPDFSAGITFGGQAVADAQTRDMYNNGVVRGYFDWTWRAESGDWRFFMFDNTAPVLPGTKLLVKNEWGDTAPPTDIDTVVLGPTLDSFSPGGTMADPAYYGPYTLDTVGKSPNANTSAGVWLFNTATSRAEEWVSAPFGEGLHAVALHNVLFEGDQLAVPFTTTVGTIRAVPFAINLLVDSNVGQQTVEVSSTLTLPGIGGDAYGLSAPYTLNFNLPAPTGALYELTHEFTVTHAASLRIETDSAGISDLDLFLDRLIGTTWTRMASSAGGSSNEIVNLVTPADGVYRIGVDNFSGPAGAFVANFDIVEGSDLALTGLTGSTVAANTPVILTLSWNKMMVQGETYKGTILLGPSTAPSAMEIPVLIKRSVTIHLPLIFR